MEEVILTEVVSTVRHSEVGYPSVSVLVPEVLQWEWWHSRYLMENTRSILISATGNQDSLWVFFPHLVEKIRIPQ